MRCWWTHTLKSELRGIIGISAIAQWFQNLTSVSQVAVEVWIWFLMCVKESSIAAIVAWIKSLAQELPYVSQAWPEKIKQGLVVCLFYISQLKIYLRITNNWVVLSCYVFWKLSRIYRYFLQVLRLSFHYYYYYYYYYHHHLAFLGLHHGTWKFPGRGVEV